MRRRLVLLACLAGLAGGPPPARPARPGAAAGLDTVRITPGSLAGGLALGGLPWRFAPGDDPARAAPGFDDRAWAARAPQAFAPVSSGGVGWFRLRVSLDPAVRDSAFVVSLGHVGASELYLDGRLVVRFGQPAAHPGGERTWRPGGVPVALPLSPGRVHVLALRYSFHAWAPLAARMPGARSAILPGVTLAVRGGSPVAASCWRSRTGHWHGTC